MKNTSNANFLDVADYESSQPERGLSRILRRISRPVKDEKPLPKTESDLKIQKYLDHLRDYGA